MPTVGAGQTHGVTPSGGERRATIPIWALPVLVALPLWAYAYQGTLEPSPAGEGDVVALGEAVYDKCAFCHQADGGGHGSAPALTAVRETWPDWRDHLAWVAVGDAGWPAPTYGAQGRPRTTGMPAFRATLSDRELAHVVLYERMAFGGLEEGSEEFLALEAVADGTRTLAEVVAEVGLGPLAEAVGLDPAAVTGTG